MKRRTLIGVLCLTMTVLMGVCRLSPAASKKPEVPLTAQGEKLLATYAEMLASLKAEIAASVPGIDAQKKDAFLSAHAAVAAVPARPNPQGLNVVAAFLCDDPDKIQAMMKAEEWKCQAAMVPGGLANPMVQRLGVLSADRIPNVFLLRRDGTIEWQASGLKYKAEYGTEFAIYLATKVHTEVCEVQTAYEALRQGDFEKAASIFSGPFLPERDERYLWAAPRFHGLALAHMGLKQWDAALADIDAAIEAHQKGFDDAKSGPCDIMAEMRLIRATILDQLDRKDEAQAERKAAAVPASAHHTTPYGLFHARLRALRRNQNQEMETK